MEIHARDYDVIPGKSVGKAINAMFDTLRDIEGEKTLIFETGDYYISSDDVPYEKLYITNTIGEKEWHEGEAKLMHHIALYLKGIDDLTIEGNDARFLLDGELTNMVVEQSSNIAIRNVVIDTLHPNMHELKITKVRPFYFDFELDKGSQYIEENGSYYFVGKDYKMNFFEYRLVTWWDGVIKADSIDNVKRTGHPLFGVIRLRELAPHKFRAYSIIRNNIKLGNRYYVFDTRRKNVGIFIDRCKDVTLDNVTENFSHALACVAEDTENIVIKNCNFEPSQDSGLLMSSTADFVHLCMCRGDIVVNDNVFIGAHDDVLNVHGIHFEIVNIEGKKMRVRFMHPQAYGFNPLRVGDEIEFVDKKSLLPLGSAHIEDSKMQGEYDIELTLDKTDGANVGMVIEDVSATPNFEFQGNYMNRIITRGILVTTRGKVVIRSNNFNSTSMHSILFSDDANSWYESGRVEDVLIENNTFGYCPMYNIYIKPENREHKGTVHGDFVIRNNTSNSGPTGGLFAKSTRSITLAKNNFTRVDTENVDSMVR